MAQFHLYEVSKIAKLIEGEKGMMMPGDGGEGKGAVAQWASSYS